MRNTKDAIRYGIETLGVTPEEMFSLIESSEGYSGDDYKRWLASKIIDIAEKDGVGFTQLLVKRFSITQSLAEEYSDDSIKEEWVAKIKELLNVDVNVDERSVYSVGMEDFGNELEDIDWFNGIDLDEVNGNFVSKRLPEEFKNDLLEDNNVTLFCKLSSDSPDKGSDLFKELKTLGITCKSEGALMLHRAIQIVKSHESCTNNFRFAFLASSNFLTDRDNEGILKLFLSYFKYDGFVVDSTELLKDSFTKSKFVLVDCFPRTFEDEMQDGFVLSNAIIKDGALQLNDTKRYSQSEHGMLGYLEDRSLRYMSDIVCVSEEDGMVVGFGCERAYGYLIYNDSGFMSVESFPRKGYKCLPIIEENFKDVVVYFSVVKCLKGFGFTTDVKEFLSGHTLYEELFYNCLPIFLFGSDNMCCSRGVVTLNGTTYRLDNKLDYSTDLVKNLLESGEVLFSFEAKQLLDIVKTCYEKKPEGYNSVGKTFGDLRVALDNDNIIKQYLTANVSLSDFINTLYRKM